MLSAHTHTKYWALLMFQCETYTEHDYSARLILIQKPWKGWLLPQNDQAIDVDRNQLISTISTNPKLSLHSKDRPFAPSLDVFISQATFFKGERCPPSRSKLLKTCNLWHVSHETHNRVFVVNLAQRSIGFLPKRKLYYWQAPQQTKRKDRSKLQASNQKLII